MKKFISRFHYLTQDHSNRSHVKQAQIACEAGANWIQYRCFSKTDQEMIEEINQVAAICDDWGATLILTDHYHLLNQVDVQGIHLENMEADFKAVRNLITDEKTLGASANSMDDIKRVYNTGVVDYAGCGPFSITRTKPNNYPLVGLEGYKKLISQMMDEHIDLPLLAVGGIKTTDVKFLMETGVYGVAVSAAINLSDDPGEAFREMYNQIR
ncbi:MAG: thiamine phosphate synthase [Flavobacterium sp.]|nr:thiamine phosphate synthase [Pedobacter sp.]